MCRSRLLTLQHGIGLIAISANDLPLIVSFLGDSVSRVYDARQCDNGSLRRVS